MVDETLNFNASRQKDFHLGDNGPLPQWCVSQEPVPFEDAIAFMQKSVEAISQGHAPECVWLLEHPPLYTAGISAKDTDLLRPDQFPVFATDRGGQYTYHGPGQRVVYLMLDLKRRQRDVRGFVEALEAWVIAALLAFNVEGHIRQGRVGVWVERRDKGLTPPPEDKIAAIGIKLKHWVSFHGISLNVEPDLEHFSGIVPCGISAHGVTSLVDLGLPVTMDEVDYELKSAFERVFGPVVEIDTAPS
jgi:lipoyl(octanoyl) transferase